MSAGGFEQGKYNPTTTERGTPGYLSMGATSCHLGVCVCVSMVRVGSKVWSARGGLRNQAQHSRAQEGEGEGQGISTEPCEQQTAGGGMSRVDAMQTASFEQ